MLLKRIVVLVVSGALLAGCAAEDGPDAAGSGEVAAPPESGAAAGVVEVADNHGVVSVPFAPERVVTMDSRTAELLGALGVEAEIADTPEQAAKARPELVVAGAGDPVGLKEAVPEAAVVDISPREEPPLDWEMVRQVQVLGQIFGREEETKQLDRDFSEALVRAKEAYRKEWTAAAVTVDGETVKLQPGEGDALWQPVFEMVGMKPAANEAAADVLLVEDKESDVAEGEYVSSISVLSGRGDLRAMEKANVYVAPIGSPAPASIVTYTLLLNELANHWATMI